MPPGAHHQAQCALCLKEITRRDQFVISQTEVFHLVCVKAHGTAQSVANRLRDTILAQAARIKTITHEVESMRAQVDEAARLRADLVALRQRFDELGQVHRATVDREIAYVEQRDRFRRERDEAIAQRDAARREAALHQTISGAQAQAPPAQASADPATQDDGKDGTEKRFSLLELD